jgi:Zn-dependent peptidase ImmA (M78 family)
MAPRYQLARRRAVEVLEKARITKAPVPVEKIANLLGAQTVYEPFSGELSGFARRNSDGTGTIGVNSLHSSTRQRFTIAHEIGHLLLHASENLHVDENFPIGLRSGISGKAIDEREIEANQFAAELLMPTDFLKKDVIPLIGMDAVRAIEKLAMKYRVSKEAMSVRLTALRYVEL